MEWVALLMYPLLSLLAVTIGVEAALFFLPSYRRVVLYSLPMVAAIGATGIVAWIMFQRVGYAYELEWIEGGMLQQVIRITEGLSPYGKPSVSYVSAQYMPLYFYVSAFFTTFLGKGFAALRAVSVLASVITAVSIALSVFSLSKSKLAAVLAALAYASIYSFSGYWFDVARVDNLWTMFLLLTLLSLIKMQLLSGRQYEFLVVIFFSLAILCKQASLFVAPFIFLAVWVWFDFYKAFWLSSGVAAIVAVAVIYFQWESNGWFLYFTFLQAPAHGLNYGRWEVFLLSETLFAIPIIFVCALDFIRIYSAEWRLRAGWFFIFLGFFIESLLSRMYPGGVSNVLMPYYALLTVMGVCYFALMIERYGESHYRWIGFLSVLLAFNIYHGWVAEAAEYRIPTRRAGGDDAIGDALVKKISQVPGRVCVTMHGYLGYMAGKDFCSHRLLLQDILLGVDGKLVASIQAEAREKIMSGYYQVIVIDDFAEINSFGVNMKEIPYTMTLLENSPDYPQYEFYPIVSGSKPMYWLEYNGTEFIDNSKRITQ